MSHRFHAWQQLAGVLLGRPPAGQAKPAAFWLLQLRPAWLAAWLRVFEPPLAVGVLLEALLSLEGVGR